MWQEVLSQGMASGFQALGSLPMRMQEQGAFGEKTRLAIQPAVSSLLKKLRKGEK